MKDDIEIELAKQVAREAAQEISLAWELIAEAIKRAKTWFTIAMALIVLWICTIGVFILYFLSK